MAKSEMTVKISWWYLWIYIPCLILMIHILLFLDFWPDLNEKRFGFWIKKAIKIKKK